MAFTELGRSQGRSRKRVHESAPPQRQTHRSRCNASSVAAAARMYVSRAPPKSTASINGRAGLQRQSWPQAAPRRLAAFAGASVPSVLYHSVTRLLPAPRQTARKMSGNKALDGSLALLQDLQDTAERSWRAFQEEEERRQQGPLGGASAGSPAFGVQSGQLPNEPGEALLTPPTKAPGEVEALELSAHQRKLAAVWRQDLSGPSDAAPLRLRSPPNSERARTALPPASIKSPNRLLSPFCLGAGASHPGWAQLAYLPCRPRPTTHPSTRRHPSPTPTHTHNSTRGRRAIGAQCGRRQRGRRTEQRAGGAADHAVGLPPAAGSADRAARAGARAHRAAPRARDDRW